MNLSVGEEIYFSSISDGIKYKGNILDLNRENITIKTDRYRNFQYGQSIVLITEQGDLYTEIIDIKDQVIVLKQLRSERREYFRVDDSIPIIFKRVDSECLCRSSRIISGYIYESDLDIDLKDESISPSLWKVLLNISRKLDFLIERLSLESEGLTKIDYKNVNLSASGIRFISNEIFNKGDGVEVKMLLPTHPPTGIIAYGCVVRVKELDKQKYEVALVFSDMHDDVRDEIIKYTINRQREILKRNKDESGKNF
jgi:hypothetical protein